MNSKLYALMFVGVGIGLMAKDSFSGNNRLLGAFIFICLGYLVTAIFIIFEGRKK